MKNSEQELARRLEQLRESFDRTFAEPEADRVERMEEFLIVGAGTGRYGLQVDTLLGLVKQRTVVPLPIQVAGLIGLAGFRGQLIPVFSLASFLADGHEAGAAPWWVICKAEDRIGLAFHHFYGSARVPPQAIFPGEPAQGTLPVSRRSFRGESGVVSIIDVSAIVAIACERLRER